MTKLICCLPSTIAGLLVLFGSGPALAETVQGDFLPDWSAVSEPFFPLEQADLPNPVLTAADVTDGDALFLADPLIFREDDLWYMFFEAYCGVGRIALATSPDGLRWTYDRLVLSQFHHISYPYVFKWCGDYYMIPEMAMTGVVKIFRATDFPYGWEYENTLLSGCQMADPTIFHFRGIWYMFGSPSSNDRLFLYYSSDLLSGWVQHPKSPVAVGSDRSRPAGRVVLLNGDRIFRMAQKNDVSYGQGVRVFEIDSLSTSYYSEHEIPESPILFASGSGWNQEGMHTCDPWWNGRRWIAATDGCQNGDWTIGICQTTPAADAPFCEMPFGAMSSSELRLASCVPTPLGDHTTVSMLVASPTDSAPMESGPAHLCIHDMQGRTICTLFHGRLAPGRTDVRWKGTDAYGRTVPAGRYFARLSRGSESVSRGLTVIR